MKSGRTILRNTRKGWTTMSTALNTITNITDALLAEEITAHFHSVPRSSHTTLAATASFQ